MPSFIMRHTLEVPLLPLPASSHKRLILRRINLFVLNITFAYSLKASENCKVFKGHRIVTLRSNWLESYVQLQVSLKCPITKILVGSLSGAGIARGSVNPQT